MKADHPIMTQPPALSVRGEIEPHDEWTSYAMRSALMGSDGIVPQDLRGTAQTAYFAYVAAWNRRAEVDRAHTASLEAEVARLRAAALDVIKSENYRMAIMVSANAGPDKREFARDQYWKAFDALAALSANQPYGEKK